MTEELLSAFVDGEDVDPVALATALAEPGARDILLDYVLLRAAVRAETGDRLPWHQSTGDRLPWHQPRRRVVAALAAAAAVVAIAGGIWFARVSRPDPNAPPAATRVMKLECGRDWNCRS